VRDAEKFKAQDESAKELIEAKSSVENYAFSLRNSIRDEKIAVCVCVCVCARARACTSCVTNRTIAGEDLCR
jgi:hypothetical protein